MKTPERWLRPDSDAPERARVWLEAHDAEPPPHSRERGWRRLEAARRRAPRPRWVVRSALAAAALAALLIVFGRPDTVPSIRLTLVEGAAGVEGAREEPVPGLLVDLPAELWTGDGARVVGRTSRGDTVGLAPAARLEIHAGATWRLDLVEGAVEVDAAPRTGDEHLRVRAGPWRVDVVGTRFSVTRLDPRHVKVTVREGVVRVRGPGWSGSLEAGETFDSRAVAPAASPRTPPATETSTASSPAPASARATPPPAARPPPRRAIRRRDDGAASRTSSLPPAPAPPPEPSVREQQLDLLEQARAAATVDAQLELLDRAVDLGPPLDEIAAYRGARRAREAGRVDEAIDRLRRVVERWPTGELTQEAYLDQVELQLELGEVVAADHTIRELARDFPAASRRPEMRFLQAEIARASGAWLEAATHYRHAARDPRFVDAASFLEALCRARTRATPEVAKARNLMSDYLLKFPNGRFAEEAKAALKKPEVESLKLDP